MKNVKRIILSMLVLSLSLGNTLTYAKAQNISEVEYVTLGDKEIKIERIENEMTITTLNTGEVEKIVFHDDKSATYYGLEGITHEITSDGEGTVYLDGEVALEETVVRVPRSSMWGDNWHYVTTVKTSQSLYDSLSGVALGLLAFVPTIGTVAGIAGIVGSFISATRPNAYYVIVQYRSSDYTQVRERVYVYANEALTDYRGYKDTPPRRTI